MKETTSVRVDAPQRAFIEKAEMNVSKEFRQLINNKRIENGTSICANCGHEVFQFEETQIGGNSPLGKEISWMGFGLQDDWVLQFCEDCMDPLVENAAGSDSSKFTCRFISSLASIINSNLEPDGLDDHPNLSNMVYTLYRVQCDVFNHMDPDDRGYETELSAAFLAPSVDKHTVIQQAEAARRWLKRDGIVPEYPMNGVEPESVANLLHHLSPSAGEFDGKVTVPGSLLTDS